MTAHAHLIHEQVEELLGFFKFDHLPPMLKAISKPFHDLAHEQVRVTDSGGAGYGRSWELVEGLRNLLLAKDCFVRAALLKPKET